MSGPTPARRLRALSFLLSCLAGLASAPLPAQLIPKVLTPTKQDPTPTRLSGVWEGTARETIAGNQELQYALSMNFSGEDAALRLEVSARAKVPAGEGRSATVEILANYLGSLRSGGLNMRSDRISVRVVETGEEVPSSPQQVEAKLENGVLTGRVGNEGEGWTTFTARPIAGNRERGSTATVGAAPGFTGRWRGTCREMGPDQKEMSYPIMVEFTGSGRDLRAKVAADLRYPMQDGSTTAVEYRATFRGDGSTAELKLRSESVEIRLPELGRANQGPTQELTGRIEQGVLRANIGGAGQGDSHLELQRDERAVGTADDRPVDSRDEVATDVVNDGDARKAPAFAGRWSGTCREVGPDNKEISYPISVDFSGGADDLRAELAADLRYPMQGGRTTPVEIRATFRGSAAGNDLNLTSERVAIRIPELQRNEVGPEQTIVGRFEQGTLRARLSASGQSDSQLELRPEAATRTTTERRDGDTDRSNNRSSGSPYGSLILERREVRDPGLGNVVSHTMLVPRGWDFAGEVTWTRNLDSFVVFQGTMTGPDREELHFDRPRQFSYQTVNSQLGQQDDNRGQEKPDGSIARKAPRGPGEVAVEVILRELRPQASQIQLVNAARQPELEDKVRELHKDRLAMLEGISRNARVAGPVASESSIWLVVERSRIRYEEGNTQWEEEVRCTMIGMHGGVRSEAITTESGVWTLLDVTTARAPVGQLDARLATLWTLAAGLQQTPRWNAAINDIRLAIMKAQTEGLRASFEEVKNRGEMLAKSQAELSAMQMQTWRDQDASSHRVQRATIETIQGVHDYRDADGDVHTVTNLFDRAFINPKGSIILTSDPNYRPSADPQVNQIRWDEMKRIDPFRTESK